MRQLVILMIIVVLASCNNSSKQETSSVDVLPYYDEATFTPKWYDSEGLVPQDFHKIPEFSLINQLGDSVSEKLLDGKITIVDFFFTSCPGICPKMTGNMTLVQEEFLNDDHIMILSHSVTPEHDSVSVLKDYAIEKGVVDGKWHLLTGDRKEIYMLGRSEYFVEEDLGLVKSPDDFLHTENFILVDANRHIRGIYNGLNKTAINQLIADIKTLESTL
ncbi:protein SCO1/2 [Catalinimonas alkaloidigena]|uniref:SCO family protein n=1 Tax=Catalinimonas alkaloidigena TaxID=1075417 RepID=UPI002406CEEC|nr:SCO family protein [Catalinimonas alkaloidigena]MDF9799313.1 protein SCO1/2 [Catalinimonas alkaloidigena]